MKGITFGNLHSYDDLNLILTKKEIGSPEVKIRKIDIEGADSSLDLTDFFGEPKYEDMTHKFEFATIVPQAQFLSLFSTVKNALHGKKMRIILDDDPQFFYMGRLKVSSFSNEKNIGRIIIEAECEPYKYRVNKSSKLVKLCGKNMLKLDDSIFTVTGPWTTTETGFIFNRGSAAGGSFAYFRFPVMAGQQYVFSALYSNPNSQIVVYTDRLYGNVAAQARNGNPAIFTATETGVYMLGLYVGSGTDTAEFSNVMLETGGTISEYEAYNADTVNTTEIFNNLRKTAVPKAYIKGSVTMVMRSESQSVSTGDYILPNMKFNQGDNSISFSGNGIVIMEWQEGCL